MFEDQADVLRKYHAAKIGIGKVQISSAVRMALDDLPYEERAAAVAQLAPAFFGGLIWRRATARGAMAGMMLGILVWAYTLLLPTLSDIGIVGERILTDGPWGLSLLTGFAMDLIRGIPATI